MEEVHQGICGPHMNERILAKKILRIGYYWNRVETNQVDFVKSCHDCQTHATLNHVPPSELYSITSPWPFSVWGIDVIGKIAPKASNGHEYNLVAIDYFTKQVEVAFFFILKAKHVARFIRNNLICRYGVSQEIISDNGSHLEGEVRKFMELYNIEHYKSLSYRPQTNGAVEVANKNVKNILAKMVITYKDWAKKLPFRLQNFYPCIGWGNPLLFGLWQ